MYVGWLVSYLHLISPPFPKHHTDWKKGYYAAHRTATFPAQAFIPVAILVGFGGLLAQTFLPSTQQQQQQQQQLKKKKGLPANGTNGSKIRPAKDKRLLFSAGLGVLTWFVFARQLVPRQDFVASVVVEGKAQIRSAVHVHEALKVIKQGHALIAAILLVLIALQVSLLVEEGGGGGRGGGVVVPEKKMQQQQEQQQPKRKKKPQQQVQRRIYLGEAET